MTIPVVVYSPYRYVSGMYITLMNRMCYPSFSLSSHILLLLPTFELHNVQY